MKYAVEDTYDTDRFAKAKSVDGEDIDSYDNILHMLDDILSYIYSHEFKLKRRIIMTLYAKYRDLSDAVDKVDDKLRSKEYWDAESLEKILGWGHPIYVGEELTYVTDLDPDVRYIYLETWNDGDYARADAADEAAEFDNVIGEIPIFNFEEEEEE